VFEVVVSGTVTAKVKDKVAFLIEAKQAGIFDIRNIPDEQLDPLVGIACPTILFPYLRSNRRRDHACRLPADPPRGNQLPGAVRAASRAASAAGRCGRRAERHDAELTFHSGPVLGMKVAVLGAGAWGTALAGHLAARHDTLLWARDAALIARLQARHENSAILEGIRAARCAALRRRSRRRARARRR
jgi:hypothetical protein